MSDEAGTEVTADAAPVAEDTESTPKRRRWRDPRVALFGGALAAVVGVVLLVIGVLGFVSSSNDHSSADQAKAERHRLQVAERQAVGTKTRISDAAHTLVSDVEKVT